MILQRTALPNASFEKIRLTSNEVRVDLLIYTDELLRSKTYPLNLKGGVVGLEPAPRLTKVFLLESHVLLHFSTGMKVRLWKG